MTPSRRVLFENILSLTILQVLNYAAPLISLPYLARVLQPAHFGLLSYAQSIILYFDLFTDFGFNFSATRAISTCRHDHLLVSRIFWSTLVTKMLLMCVSAAGITLLIAITPKFRDMSALLAVNFLYVVGTTFFPVWYFQGLERIKRAALLFGIARLLTIPALILLVKGPQDYVTAGAIQASVEVVASVFALPLLLRQIHPYWPTLQDIRETLKLGWPLFLSASALQLTVSSTTVILGSVRSRQEVGYFSVADKFIKAATAALNPIGLALYPRIAVLKSISRTAALSLIRKAFLALTALSLIVSAVTLFGAGPFCWSLLGNSFAHSVVVLRCLSPLPFFYGLMSVFGTQTMLIFEMEVLFSRIMVCGALVSLPVTILLSSRYGAVGAAIAQVFSAALIACILLIALSRKGLHVWRRQSVIADQMVPMISFAAKD